MLVMLFIYNDNFFRAYYLYYSIELLYQENFVMKCFKSFDVNWSSNSYSMYYNITGFVNSLTSMSYSHQAFTEPPPCVWTHDRARWSLCTRPTSTPFTSGRRMRSVFTDMTMTTSRNSSPKNGSPCSKS